MTVGSGTYGRALLIFHHILSSQKKKTIGESARVLNIYGICKVGYPGMLVAEGQESELKEYTRRIKSLRWQSCTLSKISVNLLPDEMLMSKALPGVGIQMVDKMSEVGSFMRAAGVEKWWRLGMGYTKDVDS